MIVPRSAQDLAAQSRVIRDSGFFDDASYRISAMTIGNELLPPGVDLVRHYLTEGERKGYRPSARFDPKFYVESYPDVAQAMSPLLHYVLHGRAEGRLAAATDSAEPPEKPNPVRQAVVPLRLAQELAYQIRVVRESGLFDDASYRISAMSMGKETLLPGVDLVQHYLIEGERKGYRPSAKFDPKYYLTNNPDVGSSMPALLHYLLHGQSEGRLPAPVTIDFVFPQAGLDPDRKTIVLLVHDASRTGAPIIGWNLAGILNEQFNVVVVLMNGGELVGAFANIPNVVVVNPGPQRLRWDFVAGRHLARELVRRYRPVFAIANSVATRFPAPELARELVPVVALVHEFPHGFYDGQRMDDIYEWASALVFSGRVVERAARERFFVCDARECLVLPQGRPVLPGARLAPEEDARRRKKIIGAVRPPNAEQSFIVVGMGSVDIRKGVDVFLTTAAHVFRIAPDANVRFCWVGDGYNPNSDNYSGFLNEQVRRSGLEGRVEFIDAVTDTGPVYEAADLLFLSSRLDPMPNVCIDSAFAGVPVLCFAEATGMAELLEADEHLRALVVPYLDDWAAALAIVRMASDEGLQTDLSDRTRALAAKTFDMASYARQLVALGEKTALRFATVRSDSEFLANAPAFDDTFYRPQDGSDFSRGEALRHYLVQSAVLRSQPPTYRTTALRRPVPGFHPIVYAEKATRRASQPVRDPLVEYVQAQMPKGPWKHPVLRASDPEMVNGGAPLRIAVHGHFHYVELLPEFLQRLAGNRLRCDLFISVTSHAGSREAARFLADYDRGSVEIAHVPNRGRNVAPLLTGFADSLRGYDVVGHIHGKRSISVSKGVPGLGERWRAFLWQNLLGAEDMRMAERIVSAFARDARLGLVFAEDPNLSTWGVNYRIAGELAVRLGIETPLPDNFDFPAGVMFWARAEALEPLFSLRLGWNDYPEEPVPDDGTMLHAIERLLPFSAAKGGFHYATTYVPGLSR